MNIKSACQNGGHCVGPDQCECPVGYSGQMCQYHESRPSQCSYTPHLLTTLTGTSVTHQRHAKSCLVRLLETRHLEIDFVTVDGDEMVRVEYKQNSISINSKLEISQAETNLVNFVTRVDSVGNVLVILDIGSVIVNSISDQLAVYIKLRGSAMHLTGLCAELSVSLDSFDHWSRGSDACHLPFSVDSGNKNSVTSVCQHLLRLGNFGDCIAKLNIQQSAQTRCETHIQQCSNVNEPLACSCAFLTELSHQCTQANIRVDQWRTESFCSVEACPSNLRWSENMDLCSTTCQTQRFIANDPSQNLVSKCDQNFMSGCSCPVGFVLREDGQCVSRIDCGCENHGQIYSNGEVIDQNCQSCVCQNHHWQCQARKCAQSCVAKGAGHIDTFDQVQMTHRTHGTYQLVRDDQSAIQLNAEFGPCELNEHATCFHMAELNIKVGLTPKDVRFGPGRLITVNTQSVMLPLISNDLIIYNADSKIIVETKLHLKIEFEPAIGIKIYANHVWQNHLSGLCGNYNGQRGDEFMTSLGFVGQKQNVFISSWLIPGKGSFEPSSMSPSSITHCSKKSFIKCNVILNLMQCSSVLSPETFITRCQEDVCNGVSADVEESILCSYLSQYINQCNSLLHSTLYSSWRKEMGCLPSCGENEVYSDSYFPIKELCRLDTADNSIPATAGCACLNGYARDSSGKCVPRSQCPCYDEKGLIVLTAGEGNYQDGSFCKCSSGQIKCQMKDEAELTRSARGFNKKQCRKGMKMMSSVKVCGQLLNLDDATRCGCIDGFYDGNTGSCVPTENDCSCDEKVKPKATLCQEWKCKRGIWVEKAKPCPTECSVYGTDHVRTFDGRGFSFGGNCETILATNQCTYTPFGYTNTTTPMIRISAINQMCDSSPDLVCSKKITIVHEHGTYEVFGTTEDSGRRIINKEGIPPLYGVRHVGLYVIIQVSPEITVMWDASLQIYIIAEQSAKDKLCGVCGNNNGQMDDDAQVRDGSSALSGVELGNGWKVSVEDQCSSSDDFCLTHDQRKSSFAHENCKVLKSATFAECASVVNVIPYYDACVKSACSCSRGGDCECLCASIAAYARTCALAGYAVRWRNENLCPLMCEDREAKPGGKGFKFFTFSFVYC